MKHLTIAQIILLLTIYKDDTEQTSEGIELQNTLTFDKDLKVLKKESLISSDTIYHAKVTAKGQAVTKQIRKQYMCQ